MKGAGALGVLGGSFDPVHLGHLIIAQEVKEELGLERVLFVPAGQPNLKDREVSLLQHRLEMVRRAIADNPAFALYTGEIEHPGVSYSVETLSRMREEWGTGVELVFILGWDALAGLPLWHQPQRLLTLCRLAAVPRPGFPPPEVSALEAALPGLATRLYLLSGPVVGISSTQVRERVRQGRSIRYLVPAPVAEYIEAQRLYRC